MAPRGFSCFHQLCCLLRNVSEEEVEDHSGVDEGIAEERLEAPRLVFERLPQPAGDCAADHGDEEVRLSARSEDQPCRSDRLEVQIGSQNEDSGEESDAESSNFEFPASIAPRQVNESDSEGERDSEGSFQFPVTVRHRVSFSTEIQRRQHLTAEEEQGETEDEDEEASEEGSESDGDGELCSDDDISECSTEVEENLARRRQRRHRTLEEKATSWKLIRQPEFEAWAESVLLSGRAQPVPQGLQSVQLGAGADPARLLQPPMGLTRSMSMEAFAAGRSAELPAPMTVRRNADGDPVSFIAWQDKHGRTGRGLRQQAAAAQAPRRSEVERSVLRDAVKKRAGEQCMPLLVATYAQRVHQRGQNALQQGSRQEVRAQAQRFDSHYGLVQTAIEGKLCFQPPKRSNSVTVAEIERSLHMLDFQQ